MTKAVRILVVDDSPVVVTLVGDSLRRRGFEVIEATNGEEGLARVRDLHPDLIVSDVQMPAMDGWAFCTAVRASPTTEDIPFIFLTVEGSEHDIERGLNLGASGFLAKPFAIEALHETVDRVLAESQTRAQHTKSHRPPRGFAGELGEISQPDIIQIFAASRKSGEFRVRCDGRQASFFMMDGRPLEAVAGPLRGAKAFNRMLRFDRGRFEFIPENLDVESSNLANYSLDELLFGGLKFLDGLQKLHIGLDDDPVLHLAPALAQASAAGHLADALAAVLNAVPASPERANIDPRAISDAVFAARAGETFFALLDHTQTPDAALTGAVALLCARGALALEHTAGPGGVF